MHILILNGPPGSGKDKSADYMVSAHGYTKLEMKGPLRALAHKISGSPELCNAIEFDPVRKNTEVREEFGGRTWRQFLIWLSEDVCKPIFGDDVFARAAIKAVRDSGAERIVFSDGGFPVEVGAIWSAFKSATQVVQLHRKDCSFEASGDSRRYVAAPDGKFTAVINDRTLAELYDTLDLLVEERGRLTGKKFWCCGCQLHRPVEQKSDRKKGNCPVCQSCKEAHPRRKRRVEITK